MTSIVLSCICVQNLRQRYGNERVSVADQADNYRNIITGQLRNENPLIDRVTKLSANSTTKASQNKCE
ncbi:hypothetical protein DPMN_078730 [Dreissena polymorpha]|uniref:Uncharacterized protein n=1 Tax=Dreissena polymorpha TaxID=45954 RepID=A0A9D3YR14_DREPO|nr:hypothetical protein DPMN_078730 [Dreissena polymorpha]